MCAPEPGIRATECRTVIFGKLTIGRNQLIECRAPVIVHAMMCVVRFPDRGEVGGSSPPRPLLAILKSSAPGQSTSPGSESF